MLFLCASASRLQYLWQSFTRKQTIEIEKLTKLNVLFQTLQYYSPGFTNSKKVCFVCLLFFTKQKSVEYNTIKELIKSYRGQYCTDTGTDTDST